MPAPIPGRVLLVVLSFPSPSQTFIVDQFLHLLARGWDVHLIARHRSERIWPMFPEIKMDPELMARIHFFNDVSNAIRALRPQLVHFEFGNLAIGHLQTCRERGIVSVVGFRGFDICFHQLHIDGYYDEVWNEASMLHCASESLWQRCLARGCPPEKPHQVVADGVDTAYFNPGERRHTDVAGTRERPLRLLSVGRLVWKKGHEYAVQSLAQLQSLGIHAQLTIIGGGNMAEALRFTAWDLGVFGQLDLQGSLPRDRVRAAMEHADVLISSSVSEGFGVSVLEGQAMMLPIVCTDAEGLEENVEDGVTGFVTPRRDPAAMTARLAELAAGPALRQRMAEAGRARVGERFRIDQEIDGFEWLYFDAVEAMRSIRAAT